MESDGALSRMMGEIDTIVSVLDTVEVKEKQALQGQLLSFRDQIVSKRSDISLASLQRNVDLVARSVGIENTSTFSNTSTTTTSTTSSTRPIKRTSAAVSVHCWHFKHKAKKALRVPATSCKNLRAFSLRLLQFSTSLIIP